VIHFFLIEFFLDSTLALARADDSGGYEGKIIAHTTLFATTAGTGKTMDQWERELTEEDPAPAPEKKKEKKKNTRVTFHDQ